MKKAHLDFTQAGPRPLVLALDLEATLISSAGLFNFLERCRALFPRVVMFTTVREERFRVIAESLVAEGLAPKWFAGVEYVLWQGATKDLAFVPGCDITDCLLVDDLASYVHPGQESQWVEIEPFEPPFADADSGLAKVLAALEARVRQENTKG
jgi:hypothetical protein